MTKEASCHFCPVDRGHRHRVTMRNGCREMSEWCREAMRQNNAGHGWFQVAAPGSVRGWRPIDKRPERQVAALSVEKSAREVQVFASKSATGSTQPAFDHH